MGVVIRVVTVWAIALSLVIGTTAWRPCVATALAAGNQLPIPANDYVHGADSNAHQHHGMQHDPLPAAPAHPGDDDHGCLKCCAMCTAAAALPAGLLEEAISIAGSAAPFPDGPHLAGRMIPIDPGIPKRIA
jgi:hypothetical protein